MPPEIKLEQLASAQRELKAQQQRRQQQQGEAGKSQSGRRQGQPGSGSRPRKEGSGQGKEGSGQGKEGSGQGQGKGKGAGQGRQRHRERKERRQSDCRSPQGYLQGPGPTGSGSRQATTPRNVRTPAAKRTVAHSPVSNRTWPASRAPTIGPTWARIKIEPVKMARNRTGARAHSRASPRRDFGSSQGDTHLGQFPTAGEF